MFQEAGRLVVGEGKTTRCRLQGVYPAEGFCPVGRGIREKGAGWSAKFKVWMETEGREAHDAEEGVISSRIKITGGQTDLQLGRDLR